jgi:hypothetical protein
VIKKSVHCDDEAANANLLACLEDLYRNELMGEEERLKLRDRINWLRRKAETIAETVDTHHSGLERMDG